ncbi:hypothetical protein PM082_014834 [Marasmius tenuissimus]|nr:hypothetical protein PM082_014834 [Marasmius tenuissimus]
MIGDLRGSCFCLQEWMNIFALLHQSTTNYIPRELLIRSFLVTSFEYTAVLGSYALGDLPDFEVDENLSLVALSLLDGFDLLGWHRCFLKAPEAPARFTILREQTNFMSTFIGVWTSRPKILAETDTFY